MNLKRFLSKTRIIDVAEPTFADAVGRLLETIPDSILGGADRRDVLANLIEREKSISTYLGDGICLPHTRVVGLKQKYVFAVGRIRDGIDFEGLEDYKQTRILFLMLSDEKVDNYLSVLSNLAKIFSADDVCERIKTSPDIGSFRNSVLGAFNGGGAAESAKNTAAQARGKNQRIYNALGSENLESLEVLGNNPAVRLVFDYARCRQDVRRRKGCARQRKAARVAAAQVGVYRR